MNTRTKHARCAQAILLCLPFLLISAPASATTMGYNFDEAGWVNSAGTTENFMGTFYGTLDANGVLTLADLTSFSAVITETNPAGETKTITSFGGASGVNGLAAFLFDPATNGLNLFATGTPGGTICLGNTIAQADCGPVAPPAVSRNGTPAPAVDGIFLSSVNGSLNAATTALPTVTLIPSPIQPVTAPAPAATPEPGTLILCGLALVTWSTFLRRTNKRAAS